MATTRQIEANRANSRKSTGPRTDEGKAAVRLNALKHGLSADCVIIPGEIIEYLDTGKILAKDAQDEDIMFATPGPVVEYWEGED